MAAILFSKGDDYANEDRLSNFKLAGNICGLTPDQNCLSLIATKVARLGVLLKSDKNPNNESIRDSILDLANYAALLDMIVSEGANEAALSDKEAMVDYEAEQNRAWFPYKPLTCVKCATTMKIISKLPPFITCECPTCNGAFVVEDLISLDKQ